jgi:hypothetical protein
MKGKIFVFCISIMLVLSTGLAMGISIKKNDISLDKNNYVFKPLGVGGWHSEQSMQKYGKDFDEIIKSGGSGGGYESPYETNAVRIWAEINTVQAKYIFDINEGPVKYVKYQVEYKDVGWLSDGPDALINKWDGTWETFSNIGGGGDNDNYEWESHTFNTYSDKYVNSEGKICVAAQAWDDASWLQQDNFAVRTIKISYRAADEEIFNNIFTTYDSDDDGAVDSIQIKLDADVGDEGDGTTVDVTAICELKDPYENIIDTNSVTWTIVDHQVEYGTVDVSSLGGQNGVYKLNVILKDEFGNVEDELTENFNLVPDPKRQIDFYVYPFDGGVIDFDTETFYDNETGIFSDGTYAISAVPADYFTFDHWECTGGASIKNNDVYSPNAELVIKDNGSLKAVFSFTKNTLFFFIEPDFAGQITIEENVFENNTGCYIDEGTYNISAVSLLDEYYFYYWYLSGDITVQDEHSAETSLIVSGDGILCAVFNENTPPNKPETPKGTLSGGVYVEYTYSTKTTDADEDQVYYLFDWNDGTDSGWLGPYASGKEVKASHTWTGSRSYQIKVRAKDTYDAVSEWSDPLTIGIYSPPNAPVITGNANGKINQEYEFNIGATDPDSDDVYFYVEWGDGAIENWIGPYTSGEKVIIKHTWKRQGTFTIKALAKDEHDVVSQSWGMLVVQMPKTKTCQLKIFEILQQKHFMLKILEKIQLL